MRAGWQHGRVVAHGAIKKLLPCGMLNLETLVPFYSRCCLAAGAGEIFLVLTRSGERPRHAVPGVPPHSPSSHSGSSPLTSPPSCSELPGGSSGPNQTTRHCQLSAEREPEQTAGRRNNNSKLLLLLLLLISPGR